MMLAFVIIVMQSALRARVLAAFVLLLNPAGSPCLLLSCFVLLFVMIIMLKA
jgi:hypothetical protein